MKIRAIITGITGMVGEGVLHECLENPYLESILVLGRKPCGRTHPKLKELIHQNFLDLSMVSNQLSGFNACLFCMGVSSVGMNEKAYQRMTYELTIHLAETLAGLNPGMGFCYVSGAGTDSTEKGRSMWARVKGRTENRLLQIFPGKAYMFRPGYMQPTQGLKNTLKFYKFFKWMYPALRFIFPKYVSTLKELGIAMIQVISKGSDKQILEVQDIVKLAARR